MSSRLILAAAVSAAALAVSMPALAQNAQAAPAAPAPAAPAPAAPAPAAPALSEADVEAAGAAFEAEMQKMAVEMDALILAAGDDKARASAEADVLVTRYQPAADAFADTLNGFIQSMAAMIPPEQMAVIPEAIAKIRQAPADIKAHRFLPPEPAAPAPAAQ